MTTTNGQAAKTEQPKKEKTTRATYVVPVTKHRAFKAKCASKGIKMAEAYDQFIDRFLAKS